MRIPRIFTEQSLSTGKLVTLEDQASAHIIKVLRMKTGQTVEVFNGQGGSCQAIIDNIDKKTAQLLVQSQQPENLESSLKTSIVVSLAKGDKMDLIVQKCTELGVNTIQPMLSERSDVKLNTERLEKKTRHWQQVAISACEQCGRNLVPSIKPVVKFCDYINQAVDGQAFLFHPQAKTSLNAVERPDSIILIFGPEGGFSDTEIQACQQQGVKLMSLGQRILRAETAPLVALSICQNLWGDLSQ